MEASIFPFSYRRELLRENPCLNRTSYYAIAVQIAFEIFGFPEAMLEGEGVQNGGIDDDGFAF